jgi:hypothetical protein
MPTLGQRSEIMGAGRQHGFSRMMRFRKLRIAWSVLWGIACVLLIVSWIRSYWSYESFCYRGPKEAVGVETAWGTTWFYRNSSPDRTRGTGWHVSRYEQSPFDKPDATVFGFDWHWESDVFWVGLPHWLAATALAALAALPRLRWRFTLRTLLIATTLVAVVLGLVVYMARK